MDDRDYYGNKRLELAGQVCKSLWYEAVVVTVAVCINVSDAFKFDDNKIQFITVIFPDAL